MPVDRDLSSTILIDIDTMRSQDGQARCRSGNLASPTGGSGNQTFLLPPGQVDSRNVMFMILTLIILVAALNIVLGVFSDHAGLRDKGRRHRHPAQHGGTSGRWMRDLLMTERPAIGVTGTFAGFVLGVAQSASQCPGERHIASSFLLDSRARAPVQSGALLFLSQLAPPTWISGHGRPSRFFAPLGPPWGGGGFGSSPRHGSSPPGGGVPARSCQVRSDMNDQVRKSGHRGLSSSMSAPAFPPGRAPISSSTGPIYAPDGRDRGAGSTPPAPGMSYPACTRPCSDTPRRRVDVIVDGEALRPSGWTTGRHADHALRDRLRLPVPSICCLAFTALENIMIPQLITGLSKLGREGTPPAQLLDLHAHPATVPTHGPFGTLGRRISSAVAIARRGRQRAADLPADEPTGNLDPKTPATLFEALDALVPPVGGSSGGDRRRTTTIWPGPD